jgi:hypothetical protein
MKKHTIRLILFVAALLWLLPGVAYAAEGGSVNPPGWLGGLLAALALVLAVALGIGWSRRS